jgi:hypothetical protein
MSTTSLSRVVSHAFGLAGLIIASFTTSVAWADQAPAGYTLCASENGRCNIQGVGDVAYGASGKFAYRNDVSNGIDCNNATFGDPIYGTVKSCYVLLKPAAGYTLCASENGRCNFPGNGDVAYGANGKFVYRNGVSTGIDCNNATFGDPIYGTVKSCFVRPAPAKNTPFAVSGDANSNPSVCDQNTKGAIVMPYQWAVANKQTACDVATKAFGQWAIARLANGSQDGSGYGCGNRNADTRGTGGTLCLK